MGEGRGTLGVTGDEGAWVGGKEGGGDGVDRGEVGDRESPRYREGKVEYWWK